MKEVIGLRFIPNGYISYFEKGQEDYADNEKVIVQMGEYMELGKVVFSAKKCRDEDITLSSQFIVRKAGVQDLAQEEVNKQDAAEAFQICKETIRAFNLEMKLVNAQYSFDREKLTFLFTAAKRVDFRSLVRELASIFRTRIELRQIGARDEAKYLGGIGPCGRPLCCSTFLGDFVPVSIKMAKDQDLTLNTTKLSGICGRLLCCLTYENETYEELKKSMPDYGEEIDTPDGRGKVVGLQLLNQVVKVRLFKEKRTVEYAWEELNGILV